MQLINATIGTLGSLGAKFLEAGVKSETEKGGNINGFLAFTIAMLVELVLCAFFLMFVYLLKENKNKSGEDTPSAGWEPIPFIKRAEALRRENPTQAFVFVRLALEETGDETEIGIHSFYETLNEQLQAAFARREVGCLYANTYVCCLPAETFKPDTFDGIVKETLSCLGENEKVYFHFGMATAQSEAQDTTDVLEKAGAALHYAIANELDYAWYSEKAQAFADEENAMLAAIPDALRDERFFVSYAPQYTIDGVMIAVATQVNWFHSKKGILSADSFQAVLSRSNCRKAVEEFVLQLVCKQVNGWKAKGINVPPVSVPASAATYKHTEGIDLYSDNETEGAPDEAEGAVKWYTPEAFEKILLEQYAAKEETTDLTDIPLDTKVQKQLHTIVHNLPGGIAQFRLNTDDDRLVTTYVSDNFCSLRGYTAEEIQKEKDDDILFGVHEEDQEDLMDKLTACITQMQDIFATYRILCKDGREIWVETNARFFTENGEKYLFVYCSECKPAESLNLLPTKKAVKIKRLNE